MSHLRRVVLFLIIASLVIFIGPMRHWWFATLIVDRSFETSFEWLDYGHGLSWLFEFAWSMAAGILVARVMRATSPTWWALALGGVGGMVHFLYARDHIGPAAPWIEPIWVYGTYLVPLLGTFAGAWFASHLFLRISPTAARGRMETPARWIVVVLAGVGAAFVAVELTARLRHPSMLWSSGLILYSRVGDKALAAEVSEKELATSPQWAPDAPLPLSAEDAILRARGALPAFGPAVEGWSFSELAMREESAHFFYTITFRPPRGSYGEWIQLPVYFNGKVTIPGASK